MSLLCLFILYIFVRVYYQTNVGTKVKESNPFTQDRLDLLPL